ncbi:alcohol dehydrogenase catalytic domain-containing protein [Sodalis sp. RH21]|uniref:alcohol dehydrogenase catalytic domain-containing protein n=1 Tax=unclassified Sodalis (in: enterobacteria) TaxID=2636512 RepID=UPI0039B500DC
MSRGALNKVAVLNGPGTFALIHSPLAEIPAGYVRVKLSHCGVCGTDRSFYLGHRDEGYPVSLGHEHCGVIDALGEGVTGFAPGRPVVIDPNFRCGACYFCLRKLGHLCINGTEQRYSNRGYAGYIDIHYSYVHPLPHYGRTHMGALVEPLSVALHALAVGALQDRYGETLVLGCGGLGSLLIFAILETTAIDLYIHDHNDYKVDHLRSLYPDRIRRLGGRNDFNLVFEATGSSTGFALACGLLGKCARLVVLSRYHSDEPLIPERLPWKQPEIRFCHLNGDAIHMTEAAALLKEKWTLQHDHLLSFHALDEIDQVFKNYGAIKSNKKIIIQQ